MTAALMLGHLLDRVVAAYVVTGSVPPDPFECAVESLRAEHDERALAWLESSSQDALDELGSELVERAARGATRGRPSKARGGPGPKTG